MIPVINATRHDSQVHQKLTTIEEANSLQSSLALNQTDPKVDPISEGSLSKGFREIDK
jgi:hypothetical protein